MKLFTLTKNGKLVRREYGGVQYTPIRIEASKYCLWLRWEAGKDYGGSQNYEMISDSLRAISDEDIVVLDGHFAGITAFSDYVEHNGPGEAREQGRRCILTERAAARYPKADAKVIRSGEFYADDDHCRRNESKLNLLPCSLANAIIIDDCEDILVLANAATAEIVYHLMQDLCKEKASYEHAKMLCSTEGIHTFIGLFQGVAVAYASFRIDDSQNIIGVECGGLDRLGLSNEAIFDLMG